MGLLTSRLSGCENRIIEYLLDRTPRYLPRKMRKIGSDGWARERLCLGSNVGK